MSTAFHPILEKITGLNQKGTLCLGLGFVREEWKALCFEKGFSLSQTAISNSKQIAQAFVPESDGRILEGIARVELLREAFKNPDLRNGLPTLTQQRLRPRFYENLDYSLQQGRLLFAHAEESLVFEERLKEKLGIDPKREEFFLLNRFWERLLEVRDLWDEARLYQDAILKLEAGAIDSIPMLGQEIFKLEHFPDLPRAQHFWNELSRRLVVSRIHSAKLVEVATQPVQVNRKRAHSVEDAALFLVEDILNRITHEEDLKDEVVVIPDQPSIRRTLKRVAEGKGLLLQDPRDPTQISQSEELKLAILELEMVAKRFPAPLVLTWIGTQKHFRSQEGNWRKTIIEEALTMGIDAYSMIPKLHESLKDVESRYPSRMKLTELHEKMLASVKHLELPIWVAQVLDRLFQPWEQSLEQVGVMGRRWPIRYWYEQVNDQLKRTTPIVSPLKFQTGLQLYRVDQAVSLNLFLGESRSHRVHFFGVDSSAFETRDPGNEWLSVRDQETLSFEFGLPSFRANEAQAIQSFESWARSSTLPVFFWDFEYDESGSESENADLILADSTRFQVVADEELGMHPSLSGSFFKRLAVPPSEVQIGLPRKEWPVSFVDAYGNCAFTAYASHLLKLYDERETDFELKGDSFGNLVHQALENLIQHKMPVADAFEAAWKKTDQKAWLKSERLYRSIRYKAIRILETLQASEVEYQSLSQAEPAYFEKEISWEKEGLTLKGRIDRIDQHGDGLILIDYKTGTKLSSGADTLEKGTGMQLPVYAMAVQESFNQPVIAAQYLQLSPTKVNRNLGILFSQWNRSKKSDPVTHPITTARSNNKSVFTEDPEALWKKLDHNIVELISLAKKGEFSPRPADPKECTHCRYQLVCGRLRTGAEVGNSEEE